MKTHILLPTALLLVLAACQEEEAAPPAPEPVEVEAAEGEPVEVEPVEVEVEEEPDVVEEEPEEETEAESEEAEPVGKVTPEEEEALQFFTEVYDGIADVTFRPEEDMYMILPTDEDAIQGVGFMVYGPPPGEEWEEFKQHFAELSLNLDEVVGDRDHALVMTFPGEPPELILAAMNGDIFYDITEEE